MARPPIARQRGGKTPYPCLSSSVQLTESSEAISTDGTLTPTQTAKILTLMWGSEEAALNEMNDRLFTNAAAVREVLKSAINRRFFTSRAK